MFTYKGEYTITIFEAKQVVSDAISYTSSGNYLIPNIVLVSVIEISRSNVNYEAENKSCTALQGSKMFRSRDDELHPVMCLMMPL